MSFASRNKLQRAQENLRKSRDELAIFTEIQKLEKERQANEQELRAQKQALKQERQAQKQERQAQQQERQELDKIKEAERMKEERRQAEFKTAQEVASVALNKARVLFHEKQKRIDKARAELQAASDDDPPIKGDALFKAVATQELRGMTEKQQAYAAKVAVKALLKQGAYVAKVVARKAEGPMEAKARRVAELEAEAKAMALLAEWEAENSGKKGGKKGGAKAAAAARAFVAEWEAENIGKKWDEWEAENIVQKSAKQLNEEEKAEKKQKKLEGRRAPKVKGAGGGQSVRTMHLAKTLHPSACDLDDVSIIDLDDGCPMIFPVITE